MENSQEELERFKKEINLAALAERFGYHHYRKKSDASRIAMIGKEPEDVILIKKDPKTGYFLFINPYDTTDHGNVIHFVMNRTNKNLGEVRKYLRAYVQSPEYGKNASSYVLNGDKINRNVLAALWFSVKPLSDRKYLYARGITDKTIDSAAFKGRVGNTEYTDSASGTAFVNTAFPIYDEKGIVGIEQKNVNFKGALSGSEKGKGVWLSNLPETGVITSFFICESPVDAMAHFQLSGKRNNDLRTLYIATNGQLTSGQCDHIQTLIDRYKPLEVILGNDNDRAGVRFNCTLLGRLCEPREMLAGKHFQTPSNDGFIRMEVALVNKHLCNWKVFLAFREKDTGLFKNENLKKYIDELNEKTERANGRPAFQMEMKQLGKYDSIAHIFFHNNDQTLLQVEKSIAFLRPVEILKVDRPKRKDFAEDLEAELEQGRRKSAHLSLSPDHDL